MLSLQLFVLNAKPYEEFIEEFIYNNVSSGPSSITIVIFCTTRFLCGSFKVDARWPSPFIQGGEQSFLYLTGQYSLVLFFCLSLSTIASSTIVKLIQVIIILACSIPSYKYILRPSPWVYDYSRFRRCRVRTQAMSRHHMLLQVWALAIQGFSAKVSLAPFTDRYNAESALALFFSRHILR